MKRRNTRAAQFGFTTQTQDSEEEENNVAFGSDEENDPDGVVDENSPSYRYLWKTDWKYECPKIQKLGMSVRRFEIIRKHLKFNDGVEKTDDPYWRVILDPKDGQLDLVAGV